MRAIANGILDPSGGVANNWGGASLQVQQKDTAAVRLSGRSALCSRPHHPNWKAARAGASIIPAGSWGHWGQACHAERSKTTPVLTNNILLQQHQQLQHQQQYNLAAQWWGFRSRRQSQAGSEQALALYPR
jgi:hypothetical protein